MIVFIVETIYFEYQIVSKSKVVLKEATDNAGRKTWKRGRPGEIYQNCETAGGTGRIDRSETIQWFYFQTLLQSTTLRWVLFMVIDTKFTGRDCRKNSMQEYSILTAYCLNNQLKFHNSNEFEL